MGRLTLLKVRYWSNNSSKLGRPLKVIIFFANDFQQYALTSPGLFVDTRKFQVTQDQDDLKRVTYGLAHCRVTGKNKDANTTKESLMN